MNPKLDLRKQKLNTYDDEKNYSESKDDNNLIVKDAPYVIVNRDKDEKFSIDHIESFNGVISGSSISTKEISKVYVASSLVSNRIKSDKNNDWILINEEKYQDLWVLESGACQANYRVFSEIKHQFDCKGHNKTCKFFLNTKYSLNLINNS